MNLPFYKQTVKIIAILHDLLVKSVNFDLEEKHLNCGRKTKK